MILIHKNEFCKAEFEALTKTVRTQYIGIAEVEAITDLLKKVIVYSRQHNIEHMIANLTQMHGTFTGAMEFFEKEFYPNMIKNGLKTYAMAFSQDVFTKYASNQLQKKVGDKLYWHAFQSLNEAEEWTMIMRTKSLAA
jgi:hypothetical protein